MLAGQPLTLDNKLTSSFIRDAFRFISAFIAPISQSAPHVRFQLISLQHI